MTEGITGKVAKVTSDRELIINRGVEHGVEPGMVFRVKGDQLHITDPDTGEPIGVVSKAKVLVRVAEAADKFSIARTFRSTRVNVGGEFGGLSALSRMMQPPKWETRYETLRRDPSEGEEISEEESVVSVGDLVELVDDEDMEAEETTVWR